MNSAEIPEAIRFLLPLAQQWGIPDDLQRSLKVENAPTDELRDLVARVQAAGDDLYEWLDASACRSSDPEYIAITSLTMAADEARIILQSGNR